MGLFDIFTKKNSTSSQDKELGRLQKMVENKLSQNLDREDALHRLSAMGTPDSARVLMKRFSWTLNPSIKDQEEKELAVQGIANAGEVALIPLREYCSKSEAISWPLKAFRHIVSGERLEQELLGLLDEFDTDYMRNPEPKIQLLQVLGEFASDDVRVAVQPFLTDMSEDVRFAAVTTVLGCKSEESVEGLVSALVEEESLRVKNRIAAGLVNGGWRIPPELVAKARDACPDGFSIASDGTVSGGPV